MWLPSFGNDKGFKESPKLVLDIAIRDTIDADMGHSTVGRVCCEHVFASLLRTVD